MLDDIVPEKTLAGFCRTCKRSNKKINFWDYFSILEHSELVISSFAVCETNKRVIFAQPESLKDASVLSSDLGSR